MSERIELRIILLKHSLVLVRCCSCSGKLKFRRYITMFCNF